MFKPIFRELKHPDYQKCNVTRANLCATEMFTFKKDDRRKREKKIVGVYFEYFARKIGYLDISHGQLSNHLCC